MVKKNTKKAQAPPSSDEEDFQQGDDMDFEDDYGQDDDGSIEDLAGRIRNDSASELDEGMDSADLQSEEEEVETKPTKKGAAAAKPLTTKAATPAEKTKSEEEKAKADQEARKKQKKIEQLDKRL